MNFDPSAKKKKKKKKTAFDPEAEGGEEEGLNILQKNIKTRNFCFCRKLLKNVMIFIKSTSRLKY